MLLLAKTNLFLVVMDSVRLICEKSDSSFLEEVHTLEALTNLCFELILKFAHVPKITNRERAPACASRWGGKGNLGRQLEDQEDKWEVWEKARPHLK